MMKHGLLAAVLVLSLNVAHAKKQKSPPKMSAVDAKELCLSTKGANIKKKEMKKCVSKAMRTGKV